MGTSGSKHLKTNGAFALSSTGGHLIKDLSGDCKQCCPCPCDTLDYEVTLTNPTVYSTCQKVYRGTAVPGYYSWANNQSMSNIAGTYSLTRTYSSTYNNIMTCRFFVDEIGTHDADMWDTTGCTGTKTEHRDVDIYLRVILQCYLLTNMSIIVDIDVVGIGGLFEYNSVAPYKGVGDICPSNTTELAAYGGTAIVTVA